MSDKFAFVAADARGKIRKSDDELVRSHCMRGKNRRENSRRSRQRTKREASKAFAGEGESEDAVVRTGDARCALVPPPASDLEMVCLATTVDKSSKSTLFRFLSYRDPSTLLYPMEPVLDFDKSSTTPQFFTEHPSLLPLMLLTTSAINDFIAMQRSPTAHTCVHLKSTLAYLNATLSEKDGYAAESTILIIVTLAAMAALFEDYATAKTHLKGLEMIVRLRGGRKCLMSSPKFAFKIDRLDLSWCMSTGQQPLFLPAPVSWDPYFPGCHPLRFDSARSSSVDEFTLFFPNLAIVYNDLRCLTDLINANNDMDTQMSTNVFHGAIHSIQSRLLGLQDTISSSIAECLRLGMLAFLTTTFRVPGNRKMAYADLSRRLRMALQQAKPPTPEARHLFFWVLLISVITVVEVDEDWISGVWEAVVQDSTWEAAKQKLQAILWIPHVHDELGEQSYNRFKRKRSTFS